MMPDRQQSPQAVNICWRCMLWHGQPNPCDHDSTKPCLTCGQPRGYRWGRRDGTPLGRAVECWRCWEAALTPDARAAL
jgi:hypothetical protein